MKLTIRLAQAADLNKLIDLEAISFSEEKYHLLSSRQYRYLLTKANADIWVGEINGQITASAVVLYRKHWQQCRLYSIAVHPDFQGKGLGTKLMKYIEQAAKKNGLQGMRQEVRQDMQALINHHIDAGYHIYGQLPNYYPDGLGCIQLKKVWHA